MANGQTPRAKFKADEKQEMKDNPAEELSETEKEEKAEAEGDGALPPNPRLRAKVKKARKKANLRMID